MQPSQRLADMRVHARHSITVICFFNLLKWKQMDEYFSDWDNTLLDGDDELGDYTTVDSLLDGDFSSETTEW